ncbi:hypothetical protein O181_017583 [Austropuccinia psidii MF-1]|uniref:Uncharacterized protein n=1 Tax=Austropuccinia psidii MF-1 TaxID=1389203 RepID=A0A9Q3C7D9_9BASI|nr:hypothetical protein [Austropuccinia psidii MF-1]
MHRGTFCSSHYTSSIIIIDDTPVRSPPPVSPSPEIPNPSSPHSHIEAWQELTDWQLNFMIPSAVFHESIKQILLKHCRLLQIIPFLEAANGNEMHQAFREELSSLLGQALEAYPKEDITGIVPIFLEK